MFSLLLFLGILGIASVAIAALVGWLARTFPRSRSAVALIFTFGATFSLGFSLDLVGQAFTGTLPVANAIPPIFTWLGIGVFCQMLAFYTSPSRWPLFIPHILNGILAAFVGLSHPRHFFVALVLFFLATVLYVAKPRCEPLPEPTRNAVSVRLIITYCLTIVLGIFIASGIAWLVGHFWRPAQLPAFLVIAIWWLWVGWRYAQARDRGHF